MRNWFKGLLGKQATPNTAELLSGKGWLCDTCNQLHDGMFDLACRAPDYWSSSLDYEPNGALRMDRDFLSEDFCVLGGEDFFVRCVFRVPVLGMEQTLGFGMWSSLSRSNFQLYIDSFDDPDQDKVGPMFGYISNCLIGFEESVPEPCDVVPQSNRQRPLLFLHNGDHELTRAQQDGITPERVREIYSVYGHEMA